MHCNNREFKWGECSYIMGVINVTPDSFSGEGLRGNVEAALAQAKHFVAEGVDILDIGGESTRPDATPVSTNEELRRVIPTIECLAAETALPLSIDTYKAEVAHKALAAGAHIINDVWGLKREPEIAKIAARNNAPLIITQNQRNHTFHKFIPEVISSLKDSIDLAIKSGVDPNNIIIDPGFGFGKTVQQDLELVWQLDKLKVLEKPILIGTSRKSTIGAVLNLPVDQRMEGTAATIAISIAKGADIIRVHDIPQMVRVIKMSDAVVRGRRS
ncbi:MAG: dihydropteroate synthase [Dehalococcoidia bacterium]|nr:dihydropteroate synthase [Dehalococcoidia bacterium]